MCIISPDLISLVKAARELTAYVVLKEYQEIARETLWDIETAERAARGVEGGLTMTMREILAGTLSQEVLSTKRTSRVRRKTPHCGSTVSLNIVE